MVKLHTAWVAGSMLAFSSIAAAQLDFADVRLQVRQAPLSFSNATVTGTSTTATSASASATPSVVSASQFVQDLKAKIRTGVLAGKKDSVPFDTAYAQVDAILDQLFNVFSSLLTRFAAFLFPDLVSPLAKRDVSLDGSEFLSLYNEANSQIAAWKSSAAYTEFLASIQAASANFDSDKVLAGINAQVGDLLSTATSRLNALAASDPTIQAALNSLKSTYSDVSSAVSDAVEAGATGSTSSGAAASSGAVSSGAAASSGAASSGAAASSSTGSVKTVLTTKTTVIGATSTEVITVCTKCEAKVTTSTTVVTKTTAGVVVTVTEPCEVTYTPEGTTTKYYGGKTLTVTEVCHKCTEKPSAPLTTYVSTKGGVTYTVTEPCSETPASATTTIYSASTCTGPAGSIVTVTVPYTPCVSTIVTASSGSVVTYTTTQLVPVVQTTVYSTAVSTNPAGSAVTVTVAYTKAYSSGVTVSEGTVVTYTATQLVPVATETPVSAAAVPSTVSVVAPGTSTGVASVPSSTSGIAQVNGAASISKNLAGLVGGALLAAVFLA